MIDYSQISKGIRIGCRYTTSSNEQKSHNEPQIKKSDVVQTRNTLPGIRYTCNTKTMLVERIY